MLRLRDDQWARIREHFPEEHIPESRPGRTPVPARAVLEAVLWMLNTGAQWHLLPQCYPHYKTVHRRFQQWCEREVLREILTQLANTLREEGAIDERESFIDATFAAAKGGGEGIGPTRRGKGVKILAIVDRHVLPLSVSTHAANHHEVTLVQLSFDFYMLEAKPEHLIGDRAYDSDGLDDDLKQDGVNMIAPHRSPRKLKTRTGATCGGTTVASSSSGFVVPYSPEYRSGGTDENFLDTLARRTGGRLIHAQRHDTRGNRTSRRGTWSLREGTRGPCHGRCGEQPGPRRDRPTQHRRSPCSLPLTGCAVQIRLDGRVERAADRRDETRFCRHLNHGA